MEKTIIIDGRPVAFRATAAVPRLYRIKFRRDIMKDMAALDKSIKHAKDTGEDLAVEDLELFENVAYIMAKHADQTIPDTIDEWLECFETFSIYKVFPEILELWNQNEQTLDTSKKNKGPARGK